MKRFDFTQIGGFPLNQDRLKWMQDGYISAINALGATCKGSDPVVLTGIELISGTWSNGHVSDGWLWHPNLGVMEFQGGAVSTGNAGVVYLDETTPLEFKLSGVQNVQIKRYAKITQGSGLQTLSKNRFYVVVGNSNRTPWQTMSAINVISGELHYHRDDLSKMCHLYGFVEMLVNIALNPFSIAFKNIPLPDPVAGDTPVPFFYSTPATSQNYLNVSGAKKYGGIARISPAVFQSGSNFLNNPNGLNIQFPNVEAANQYRCSFSFSYHFN